MKFETGFKLSDFKFVLPAMNRSGLYKFINFLIGGLICVRNEAKRNEKIIQLLVIFAAFANHYTLVNLFRKHYSGKMVRKSHF